MTKSQYYAYQNVLGTVKLEFSFLENDEIDTKKAEFADLCRKACNDLAVELSMNKQLVNKLIDKNNETKK